MEGFNNCEEDIKDIVTSAAKRLTEAGAQVETVSVPMHTDGNNKKKRFCTNAYICCELCMYQCIYMLWTVYVPMHRYGNMQTAWPPGGLSLFSLYGL